MKIALLIIGILVAVIALSILVSSQKEGVSGESTIIGGSLVVAEYGYARGGRTLLYAVIRSFPTNATPEQKSNDPRFQETASGVLVRGKDGKMIPVGRDGTVYLFDGDNLRTMKIKAGEDDVGLGGCQSIDEIWASFRRFEVPDKAP